MNTPINAASLSQEEELEIHSRYWVMNGSVMQCKECGAGVPISQSGHPVRHKMSCDTQYKHKDKHPWVSLAMAISGL